MDDSLKAARKRAEKAVEDMAEGPLKIAAFQTILATLLAESESVGAERRVPERPVAGRRGVPDTLAGRILAIGSEGFFKEQRTLSEIREALGSRGWHYPLTTLSGAVQGLVQRRQLRREGVGVGNKSCWKYSNP